MGSQFLAEVSCARKGLTLTMTLTLETEMGALESLLGLQDVMGFGVAAIVDRRKDLKFDENCCEIKV